jgi:hypothetical protein
MVPQPCNHLTIRAYCIYPTGMFGLLSEAHD